METTPALPWVWGRWGQPGGQEQPHGSGRAWRSWKTLTQHKGQAQNSCARIPALRPSHLTSMSQSVLHKNILGGRREEEFQTLTLDNKQIPLFFPLILGKRGRGALPQAGIGWNSAHGFSTFVPGAGKKMIVCTFCGAWDLFLNPLCHPLTLLPPLCHLLHPPTADFPLWEAQPGAASRISGRRRQGEPVPTGQPPVPRATNAFLAMDASPHGQSCGAQPCWEPRHP